MHYQAGHKRLIAHFAGARGIHIFDIRKTSGTMGQLEYYDMHDFPMSDFDVGTDMLSDYAISCAATAKCRYDVKPINLKKPMKKQNRDYELFPGHKATITYVR